TQSTWSPPARSSPTTARRRSAASLSSMPKTAPPSMPSPAAIRIISTACGSAWRSTATTKNAARRLRASAEKLARLAHVRHFDTERGGQIDLVVLLLDQNLADLLGQREFAERLALADAVAVIAHGLVLVVEVEAQHLLGVLRGLHRLRRHRRH